MAGTLSEQGREGNGTTEGGTDYILSQAGGGAGLGALLRKPTSPGTPAVVSQNIATSQKFVLTHAPVWSHYASRINPVSLREDITHKCELPYFQPVMKPVYLRDAR